MLTKKESISVNRGNLRMLYMHVHSFAELNFFAV